MPAFLALVVLWLLALAQVGPNPPQRSHLEGATLWHTVAPGETLFSLARRYGTTVEELARLNGLKDPSRIRAGQVLRVRPGVEVALPRGSLVYFPPIQGRAFALWVEGYTWGYAEFLGVRYSLVPGEKGLWALLAVGALVEPKGYPLRLVLEGEESPLTLEVAPGGYRRETLALTPSLEELLKDPGLRAEREKVVGACPREGPLTFSRFLKPLEGGRITSAFGTRRRYGTLLTSYHEGLDFAAPLGTPVRAVAGGVVVLSERLRVRGEAVVLSHGMGLCTGYWHLSERRMRVGERVKGGQVIGLLGSTGLSTGPHLHLEVRLFGIPVDPAPFFQGLPLP
ncbi:M23 family metallopeptidase [Thermus sp. NMX2.A1]|uniref:LysM peptidoglycan-binding domain-containing M23 family metallopeptidase n=1 Tax=Thermus sp. NMX2.A1 TaxID=570924 RepID=UPI0003DCBF88|nr:M23 family metallopeptidase [Thermus sp. NMX2.A1]ETN88278.1 peptidase M23 [Thermus sp. NMX2.A1]